MQVALMDQNPVRDFQNKPDMPWGPQRMFRGARRGYGDITDPILSDLNFGVDTSLEYPSGVTNTDSSIFSDSYYSTTQEDNAAVADSQASAAASGINWSSILSSIGSGSLDLAKAALQYGPGVITAASNAGLIGSAQAAAATKAAATAGAKAPVKAAASSGMGTGTKIALGVGVLGVGYLLFRKFR